MDILMPVETEKQYREALRRVSNLEGAEPDPTTPEGRELGCAIALSPVSDLRPPKRPISDLPKRSPPS